MMRILAMTNLYPNPFQPHRATFNRHPLRILAERHAVRLIAPILWTDERKARRAGATPLPPNRQVIHDGLTVDHPRYWYTPRMLRSWYGRFFHWSVRATFHRAVANFQPDVVFTPWAYPDGWAAIRLARQAGLPVVLKVHGSDVRLVDNFRGRVKGTAEALRNADGIVAVSQELAERVTQLGTDKERIRVIIDGVDRSTFHPGDRASARKKLGLKPRVRHLLFIGNLIPVKGLDVLLDACKRLPDRLSPWELHLIGEGEMRGRLINQAEQAGLSDRIHFHGSLPHAQLPEWFRAADLFVLASRSEGTPSVLLEAAACGVPFVATAVGGVAGIARLGASKLVPPEDADQLSRAIVDMLDSPPEPPPAGPRDHQDAVTDLADFLGEVVVRFRQTPSSLPAKRRIKV